MNFRTTLIAGSAAAFAGLFAGAAHAQTLPMCSDATMVGPNPIYLSGSSAFEPTAGYMAVKLGALAGADQVTLVYSATSSCDGPTNIRDNKTLTGNADYWTANADPTMAPVKHSCVLDLGTKADLGVSDIFYENCPGNDPTIPAGLADVQGPVQAMIFIVPHSNTSQTNLTAAEAQDVWGCGMSGGVAPFTDGATPPTDSAAQMADMQSTQQRNGGSGTQGIVAKAINVPAAAFKGKVNGTGGNLVSSLMAAPHQDQTIGFLAADSFDANRMNLNALAFQGFGQTKAYYADSTVDSFDKHNVRDGHYVVWGPEHFFVAVDNANAITNPKAAKFTGWVNGTVTTAAFNFVDLEATAHVIPQCAMKVSRAQDGGFVKPYTPAAPCGCRWESVATTTATPPGCTMCTTDADCTASGKKCSNNFCE
ncbi:MAG TPA: hypothetical protein VGK52_01455 [Polyangia bacterium]